VCGVAREAYRRFGRGNHPAALNFGACFAYALARVTAEPLLEIAVRVQGCRRGSALRPGDPPQRLAGAAALVKQLTGSAIAPCDRSRHDLAPAMTAGG
jgi:hypothetical protein